MERRPATGLSGRPGELPGIVPFDWELYRKRKPSSGALELRERIVAHVTRNGRLRLPAAITAVRIADAIDRSDVWVRRKLRAAGLYRNHMPNRWHEFTPDDLHIACSLIVDGPIMDRPAPAAKTIESRPEPPAGAAGRAGRSVIERVEVHVFTFEVQDLGMGGHAAPGVANVVHEKGAKLTPTRFAVRILDSDGASGSYVTHWVGTPATLGQVEMLAPLLVGRDPDHREGIHDDLKRELRAYDHMGQGPIDIALWDLAGRRRGMSVAAMLGAFRERLPCYASTYHGQESPGGLDTPEAFADYAEECKERGFHGFKIHGWNNGDAAREIRNALGVRKRVGDGMALMLDPACELRTWMDALRVGRACDEAGFFWFEDPYRDSGVSLLGHRRLRERLRTPLLVSEHIRSLEEKADFLVGGGCDMVHADPEYDMGITGAMKIAHLCEAFGLDVQMHACGPAHRACAAAVRNTHFYEMALIGPGMPNCVPPVYDGSYSDQQEDLPPDGCVPVPSGPGLGVEYDWDFIERNRVQLLSWP